MNAVGEMLLPRDTKSTCALRLVAAQHLSFIPVSVSALRENQVEMAQYEWLSTNAAPLPSDAPSKASPHSSPGRARHQGSIKPRYPAVPLRAQHTHFLGQYFACRSNSSISRQIPYSTQLARLCFLPTSAFPFLAEMWQYYLLKHI